MFLIVDTSTERGIVAISENGCLLDCQELPLGLKNASFLAPVVSKLLPEGPISGIAVGCGPGSFTGVRVGVSFAKGLAVARSLPLIELSSLVGFVPENDGTFAALIDARIGGVYALFGKKEGEEVTIEGVAELLSLDIVKKKIQQCDYCVTPVKNRLEEKMPHPNWIERAPCASRLVRVVKEKVEKREVTTPEDFEISYLREVAS